MPELPDVAAYLVALEPRVLGRTLTGIRIASPFLLRSVDPPLGEAFGKTVVGLRRVGKRIVFTMDNDVFIIMHLMIAGRLHWKDAPAARIPGKLGLAAFDFPDGTLLFTEAGTKKRARAPPRARRAGLDGARRRRHRSARRGPRDVP